MFETKLKKELSKTRKKKQISNQFFLSKRGNKKKVLPCERMHFTTEQSEQYALLATSSESLDQTAQLKDNSSNSCVASDDEEVLLRCQKSRRIKRSRIEKFYKIFSRRRCYTKIILTTLLVSLMLFLAWKFYTGVCRKNLTDNQTKLASAEWFANASRHAYSYIPKNFTTLLEPRDVCRSNSFLLIIVYSNIDSFAERQNIRNTWGNTTDFNYGKFGKIHSDFKGAYLDPPLKRLQVYENYIVENLNNSKSEQLNITSPPSIIPVRVVFFMGRRSRESFANTEALRHLHSESNKYNDIILENFIDNYKNLTIKSVMMLKWLMSRCLGSSSFIMKCHDDVFVNIPNLLHYLLGGTIPLYKDTLHMYDNNASVSQMLNNTQRQNMTRNILMGHLLEGNQTLSEATSRSNMPFLPYPVPKTYPPYLAGSSYLMSNDIVRMLFTTARWAPLIYAEDIFITGVCIKNWKLITAQHNPLFGIRSTQTPCSLKGSITQHPINNDELLYYYKLVNDDSIKCVAPHQ